MDYINKMVETYEKEANKKLTYKEKELIKKVILNSKKLQYQRRIENIREQLKELEQDFWNDYEIEFKNQNVDNFKEYADSKLLQMIMNLECLQNGFNIETKIK